MDCTRPRPTAAASVGRSSLLRVLCLGAVGTVLAIPFSTINAQQASLEAVTNPSVVDPSARTVAGSHAYTAAGIFTVTVTVSDDDGGSGMAAMEVTVLTTQEAILDLFEMILGLELPNAPETSLTARLAAVGGLVGRDIGAPRCLAALLDGFVRGVRHWRDKGEIGDSQAEDLLTHANLIRMDILAT